MDLVKARIAVLRSRVIVRSWGEEGQVNEMNTTGQQHGGPDLTMSSDSSGKIEER